MFRWIPRSFGPFVALSCLAAPALAQQAPDAGSLLRQHERAQQRLPDRLPEAEREVVRPALKADGVRVLVKSVRFTGAAGLVEEPELQALVADAVGKELDFAGIEALARRVTDFLRGKGWFLSEAYLPRQDVTDGHIEIAVKPGRLDGGAGKGQPFAIVPEGKRALRIDPDRLAAIAAGLLPPGAAVSERDMERALLLMNDLPGVSARARLEAGAEEGSTRVVVAVEEGPPVSGSAGADNYGSRDTGAEQINLAAQVNDPAGIGDQISAGLTRTEGLELARLGYALPLGGSGLKFALSYSDMDYRVVRGAGLASGLTGESQTGGATLSYPLLRSRAANVHGALGYTRKVLRDDSAAGPQRDKRVDVWNINLSGDVLDALGGGGMTSWNLGWTAGALDLSRVPADQTQDAAGYGAQGRYDKLGYGVTRLQKLPGDLMLFANFSGQYAGKNLDSSEKLLLGGPNGVRAYPGSEGSGDSGWLANLELRYDLPGGTPLGQLQLTAFWDAGRIVLHDDPKNIAVATATGRNVYNLYGWGLGANLTRTGSHAVKLVWAGKFRDNPGRTATGLDADSRADSSRFWLQGTLWF